MTDLTKGIIDILGFEITPNTQAHEIEKALADKMDANLFSKNKKVQGIYFKNISILERTFNVDISFWDGKLKSIRLDYADHVGLPFETIYKADCEWLKSILGEPTQTGSNGIVYKFDSIQVGATNWESDGRSGPDEYIQISY